MRIELGGRAPLEHRRQLGRRRPGAVETLERLQRVGVVRVVIEDAPVEPLGGLSIARFLIEPGRPQRQLLRGVGLRARQRLFDLLGARPGELGRARDPFQIVERSTGRRLLPERATERLQRHLRLSQLVGGHVGDLAQPVRSLPAIVAQLDAPAV